MGRENLFHLRDSVVLTAVSSTTGNIAETLQDVVLFEGDQVWDWGVLGD